MYTPDLDESQQQSNNNDFNQNTDNLEQAPGSAQNDPSQIKDRSTTNPDIINKKK